MSGKVPTGVYVNQINLHKLSSCVQNQKPCTINVNTIQRKGAVRIDVLLTREQVKILNDTGSLKIKMTKPLLKKYSVRETSGGFLPFLIPLFAGLSAVGALTGGISTAVKTANERKAQLQAQKELERHNKELEKQISGSGVIVDFAEKLEGLPDKARLLVGDMLSSIAQAGVKLTKRGHGLYLSNK